MKTALSRKLRLIPAYEYGRLTEEELTPMTDRIKAMNWWHSLTFEHKFYKVIAWLKSQNRNTTDRHPDDLTGREIEEIWNQNKPS